MKKRTTLAEIMGSKAAAAGHSLSLEHLPDILGEAMPELPKNAVGRHRLVRSLQQRFGANFRALPGVSDLVKQFDKEIEFENKVTRMQAIKYRRENK